MVWNKVDNIIFKRNGEKAGEVKDVLNVLMQLVLYYGIEAEVMQSVQNSIESLYEEGYLKGEETF